MSNYIQALQRIELDEQRGVASIGRESVRYSERPARAPDEAPALAPTAESVETHMRGSTLTHGGEAIAALFDRLRTVSPQGETARVLVFAPVEAAGATRTVVDGLAGRARALAMRVGVGELARVGGQAVLGELNGGARHVLALDGGTLASAVASWLAPLGGPQLVLIEAPPVSASVDALLLAAACDGLVLVAQTGVTARAALRSATARADAVGCRTLGVVLTAT
jgi:hypothetical protein